MKRMGDRASPCGVPIVDVDADVDVDVDVSPLTPATRMEKVVYDSKYWIILNRDASMRGLITSSNFVWLIQSNAFERSIPIIS